MRIKVSYKGKCLTLGYVRKTKNSVIGWFTSKAININFVNEVVEKRDFHITYPRDGNAHFSYKFFDPINDLNYEKRIYFDEVVLKRFDKQMQFIDFKKLPRSDDDVDQHLAIKSKQSPLAENFELFTFPTSAIAVTDDFFSKINEPCDKPNNEDILVDIEKYEGKIVNTGIILYSGAENIFYFNNELIVDQKQINVFNNIFVEGYVLVTD